MLKNFFYARDLFIFVYKYLFMRDELVVEEDLGAS